MPQINWPMVIVGCAGGFLPDVLRVIKVLGSEDRYQLPTYLKQFGFWLRVVLLVVLGGVAAYFVEPEKAMQALGAGFTAPQVISSLGGAVVKKPAEDKAGGRGLRDWWKV
jgi:hypothetical protein